MHNPRAARHKGGFWDLGDPGSLYFKALILECKFNHIEQIYLTNLETDTSQCIKESFRLYQDSSGGENWNHHIHIDKDGNSTVTFKGYQTTVNNQIIESGDRASPLVTVHNRNGCPTTAAHIRQFWQNFPKAFSTNDEILKVELFPETPKSPYELQGGEQKTHTLRLSLNSQTHPLQAVVTPINVTLPLRHYYMSNALPGLLQEPACTLLDEIIDEGINGNNNFFIKREIADEYGWRHFGDIWADHETLEHGNSRSIVSHYNNQYDAILGFLKRYINTGNDQWKEILEDLVHHVVDIDTYHTDLDRVEYNHGLFWHTDHYLDGQHCTHRSFSKHHMEIDHVEQSGGGPGPEHCYTSGLLFYYFICGEERVKNAFLSLNQWADYANLGTGGILERLFEFARKDIKKIKRILKREYVFDFRFPLSRGTGNFINTLLDNYLLTQNELMIEKAAWVIKNTISPNDLILNRQLIEDIEGRWHYTILLQSTIRFLDIKESENKIDDDYLYVLSSFSHYTEFVVEAEKPYLENREILAYPNATWIAQDLRKAQILNSYSSYCSEGRYLDVCRKRDEFFLYVTRELTDSSQRNYSRILIILAQNYFYPSSVPEQSKYQKLEQAKKMGIAEKSTEMSVISLTRNVTKDIFQRLLRLNIRREIDWLIFKLRA